jgi:hypothetical protein
LVKNCMPPDLLLPSLDVPSLISLTHQLPFLPINHLFLQPDNFSFPSAFLSNHRLVLSQLRLLPKNPFAVFTTSQFVMVDASSTHAPASTLLLTSASERPYDTGVQVPRPSSCFALLHPLLPTRNIISAQTLAPESFSRFAT